MEEEFAESFSLRDSERDRNRLREQALQLGAGRFLLDRDAGYEDTEAPTEEIAIREWLAFFTDEPKQVDDNDLARKIFTEAFVEGYRAEKSRPRLSIRPSESVLGQIDLRTDGDDLLRPRTAEESISRYYQLLNRASDTLKGTFSRAEEAAIIHTLPGFPMEPFEPAEFPAHVEWAMREEPGADKQTIMEKLSPLSELQLAALLDAMIRVIPRHMPLASEGEQDPEEDGGLWPPLFGA